MSFKRIILDADGVLTDMVTAAYYFVSAKTYVKQDTCREFYESYPRGDYALSSAFGMTPEMLWSSRYLDSEAFWEQVIPYPAAQRFVESLLRVTNSFGTKVVIATQATKNPNTVGPKAANLSVFGLPVYCIWNGDKSPFDDGQSLLVDDYDKNVDAWTPGNAILFPRPWNRRHNLVDDPFNPKYDLVLAEIRKELGR